MSKAEAKLKQLDRTDVRKAGATNEYTRDLMLLVSRKYAAKTPSEQNVVRKTVVRKAGACFKKKSMQFRKVYLKKARVRASERHAELCKQREALVDALFTARDQKQAQRRPSNQRGQRSRLAPQNSQTKTMLP